jgi:hypothetical protein
VAHRRALTTARLVVRDDLMRVYVIRMSELAAELPLEVGKVAKSRRDTGRLATPEVLGKAAGEIAAYDRALDTLEEMTRVAVVDDPQVVRWRRWWHRFRLPLLLKRKGRVTRREGKNPG